MTRTSITVPETTLSEVDMLAKEQKLSRSEIFVRAVQGYLERLKTRELMDSLNKAYSEEDTEEDKIALRKAQRHFVKRVLKKEEY